MASGQRGEQLTAEWLLIQGGCRGHASCLPSTNPVALATAEPLHLGTHRNTIRNPTVKPPSAHTSEAYSLDKRTRFATPKFRLCTCGMLIKEENEVVQPQLAYWPTPADTRLKSSGCTPSGTQSIKVVDESFETCLATRDRSHLPKRKTAVDQMQNCCL